MLELFENKAKGGAGMVQQIRQKLTGTKSRADELRNKIELAKVSPEERELQALERETIRTQEELKAAEAALRREAEAACRAEYASAQEIAAVALLGACSAMEKLRGLEDSARLSGIDIRSEFTQAVPNTGGSYYFAGSLPQLSLELGSRGMNWLRELSVMHPGRCPEPARGLLRSHDRQAQETEEARTARVAVERKAHAVRLEAFMNPHMLPKVVLDLRGTGNASASIAKEFAAADPLKLCISCAGEGRVRTGNPRKFKTRFGGQTVMVCSEHSAAFDLE